MHSFDLNSNPNEATRKRNNLVLEQAMNATMYNVWVPAKDMEAITGTSTPTFYQAGRSWTGEPAHWELTEAANNLALHYYMRRMPAWQKGRLYVKAHYGVDATGGNILWAVDFKPVKPDVAPAATYGVVAIAAPAQTGTISVVDLSGANGGNGWCDISQAYIGANLRLQRRPANASDTSTADVRLYGIEIVYVESKRDFRTQFIPGERPEA